MLDFNFGIGAYYLKLVISLFHMGREVREGKLAAQEQRHILKIRIRAHRTESARKKGTAPRLVG